MQYQLIEYFGESLGYWCGIYNHGLGSMGGKEVQIVMRKLIHDADAKRVPKLGRMLIGPETSMCDNWAHLYTVADDQGNERAVRLVHHEYLPTIPQAVDNFVEFLANACVIPPAEIRSDLEAAMALKALTGRHY